MTDQNELDTIIEETRLAEEQLRLANERNEKLAAVLMKMNDAQLNALLEASVVERIAAFVEDQDQPGLADAIRDGAWR